MPRPFFFDSWERRSRLWFTAIGLPGLVWLGLFLLFPLGFLSIMSLGWDFGQDWESTHLQADEILRVIQNPYLSILFNTFLLSSLATGLCLLLSFPLCFFLWRLEKKQSSFYLGLVLAPFLINFLVRIYAWFNLLRPEGWIGRFLQLLGFEGTLISSFEGVLLGLVYAYLPFMILPIWANLSTVDTRLWNAAEDLGARSLPILYRIIIPQCLPGITAGCLLVFIPMLGEYTIPKILGGGLIPTLGTSIEAQFFSGVVPNWSFGAALASWLVFSVVILLMIFRKSLGRTLTDSRGSI